MKSQEGNPLLSHCHQAGFGRVELEFQLLEDQSDRVPRVLRLKFGPADNDEVSRPGDASEQTSGALDEPGRRASARLDDGVVSASYISALEIPNGFTCPAGSSRSGG